MQYWSSVKIIYQKYISLNVEGYDFEIGYGLDLQNPDVLRKYYSLSILR